METNYEIVLTGADDGKTLKATIKENVDQLISQRERIIRECAIQKPRETLSAAASEAKKYILERFSEMGIPLAEKEIPEVVFVAWNDKKKLRKALQKYGGSDLADERGASAIFNGVSLVFVKEDITDLDQANIAVHEMLHSVGIQVIAVNERIRINERIIASGRQGLGVWGIEPTYQTWLLEEGLVTYEAARFIDSLSNHPLFSHDYQRRQEKIEYLQNKGVMTDGKIVLDSGMEVELRYFWLMPKGRDIRDASFGLPGNSGLAGSLFELMLTKFPENERQDFLRTVFTVRRDPKQTPSLARKINDKLGKGAYTKLLKCEKTEIAVWEMIQDIRGR